MTQNKKINFVLNIIAILIGNLIYAFGVALFILPGGLITGGGTGIGLFASKAFGADLSTFLFIFNGTMFILGLVVLGKKFAASTAISSFAFPLILGVVQDLLGDYVLTEDILLCTVFAGVCVGASIGIVIKAGASTGGMDIPPLILNKFFRIPISGSLYVFDMIILGLQAIYSSGDQILYGFILIFVYTTILDKFLVLGQSKMQVKIISKKSDEIRAAIIKNVDRGVTLLKGQSGYMDQPIDVVLTIVSSRQLVKVEKTIKEIDESAFMVINSVSQVSGRGFSLPRNYK